jgi:uncharacterized membrane protein
MTAQVRDANVLPEPRTITTAAIGASLRAGLRDFLRAPAYGLFFSAVYVAGGILIWLVYGAAGQQWWLVPVVVGFPLFAPFAAIGLYEVSRRIEADERLDWWGVLSVVFAHKDRQIPSMAVVILLLFMFWIFVAHALFALFMGLSPTITASRGLGVLLQGNGPMLLAVGSVIGAGFAAVLFSITVVGVPLLLERDVDFVSAIIVSFRAVTMNLGPMVLWGLTIAVLLAIGMAPMFFGLFIVLPVLAHASWHMYRALTG